MEEVFAFLLKQLNAVIPPNPTGGDAVNFINLRTDPPGFQEGINMLLINIEEETVLRPADRYRMISKNGQQLSAQPPLRLHLILLFAAKATGPDNYVEAMKQLSMVLQFFQQYPVFRPEQYPDLADRGLEELVLEFNPLSYAQQNEIWGSMKRSYLPSVSFRVKMIVIQAEPVTMEGEIETTELRWKQ